MRAPDVVLADGDALVRDILRLACTRRRLRVVGEVATFAGLKTLCAEPDSELEAKVVVSADRLEDGQIEDALDDLLGAGAHVIVLSADPSPERLTTLLTRGAAGYLLYDSAPEEVAAGVLAVARGAVALNPTVARTVLHQWRRLRADAPMGTRSRPALTPREADVLGAMAEGLATKAIARKLGVAPKTVENHKIRVFEKLGVRSQAQAVSQAIGDGMLASPGFTPAQSNGGPGGTQFDATIYP